MKLYSHLLVAFDGSDSSRKALAKAASLCKGNNEAVLTVATVIQENTEKEDIVFHDRPKGQHYIFNPRLDPAVYAESLPRAEGIADARYRSEEEAVDDHIRFEAKNILNQYGILAEFYFLTGNPERSFAEFAEECGADLVVVGNSGKNAIQEIFKGSFSKNMTKSSPVDILIVKED